MKLSSLLSLHQATLELIFKALFFFFYFINIIRTINFRPLLLIEEERVFCEHEIFSQILPGF